MKLVVPIVFVILLLSCSKTTPAGFWSDYKKDLIKEKISDHGPNGGYSSIYWKSETPVFDSAAVFDFALKNGWKVFDEATYVTWTPRWIKGEANIYVFNSGWLVVDPATDESAEANGFVAVTKDGKEMEVSHVWGE